MEFKLKSILLYCFNDKFKEKKAAITINCITHCHQFIKFNSYGKLTYENGDDYRHEFPIVTTLDKFERSCNCLVFDIDKDYYKNKFGYTKMVVYYHDGNIHSNYGMYFYNEENGKSTHNYELEYADDSLCINITKSFNIWNNKELFEYHMNGKF